MDMSVKWCGQIHCGLACRPDRVDLTLYINDKRKPAPFIVRLF